MSRIEQYRAHARAWGIKFAQVCLCGYLTWTTGALLGHFNWPGMGWTFFAGMQFEYVVIFAIVPWIRWRQGKKDTAAIIRVQDPTNVRIGKVDDV